jgi:hypothetical protein
MNDGAKLLELARHTLRGQLPVEVPAENKYTTLMIANAMAIVGRQIEFADEAENEDDMRRLSEEIRAGNIAPGSSRFNAVHDMLKVQARQKILISNPGYLEK